MGITCPCCGLRFIVCAAHLTPDGRTVLCLNCATRWAMPAGARPRRGRLSRYRLPRHGRPSERAHKQTQARSPANRPAIGDRFFGQ
ncbi:MAG: hypothetical protein IMF05_05680, partial [Proteobacteria bacterium]|nr:hypothetical protein [Pseudomonadota bacterium]